MSTRVPTRCEVTAYESGGQEVAPGKREYLTVSTHGIFEGRVVIDMGEGRMAVQAEDLILAIQRCSK